MPGILDAGINKTSAHVVMSSCVTFVLGDREQPWPIVFLNRDLLA